MIYYYYVSSIYPSNPVWLQIASRTRVMSRPLRVRPTPSKTEKAFIFLLRARYSWGGSIAESSTRSSSSESTQDSTESTRRILLQSGTFTGADEATCLLLPTTRGPPIPVAPPYWCRILRVEGGALSSNAKDKPPTCLSCSWHVTLAPPRLLPLSSVARGSHSLWWW